MKKFLRLERLITDQQLAEIEEAIKKRYRPLGFKTVLARMGTNLCSCGEISMYQALFDVGDNTTMVEKYCSKSIENRSHIEQPEINVFNFNEFFEAIPEYRETLRQRYEELIKNENH